MLVLGIVLTAVLGLAAWLGPIVVKEVRQKRAAMAAVNSLSEDIKAELFNVIGSIGNAPTKGVLGLLVPDDLKQSQMAISLPLNIPDYPWSGKFLTAWPAFDQKNWPWPPIKFSVSDMPEPTVSTRYRVGRYCAIPTYRPPNAKKASSVLSIERMLKLSPTLLEMTGRIHPDNPALFLGALLSPNGEWLHSSGCDQVRLGLSPEYLQEYRHHKCPNCKRPMKLIIQIPGAMIHSRLGSGTAYLLGCPSHPDETITDYDMT